MRHRRGNRAGLAPVQDIEQKLDGLAPDIRHRLTNGGERRIDIARHLDIVEAHDRQRVGAGYLRRSCRRQRADRHFVAEAEDRRGRAIERQRSEEHTSELQSLMRISYAVFCLNKKNNAHTYAHPTCVTSPRLLDVSHYYT